MVCGQTTLSLVKPKREGLETGVIHRKVDDDPRRWAMLAVVSFAMLLSLTSWMTATAIGPELQLKWSLSSSQLGWLTTIVQLGFVVGTGLGAILNLADVLPSRAYFALSAFLAAVSNVLLLSSDGFSEALPARFFTGFFLAGVYPPGMKMVSTWFQSARGLAIGTVVGALTVGKATPYLLKAVGNTDTIAVIAGGSIAGLLASILIATAYRDGPYPFPSRSFEWSRGGKLLRHRETMLATGGYLGHMWELYAMWSSIPVFLSAVFGSKSVIGDSLELAGLITFGVFISGAAACVAAGMIAERIGRTATTSIMMALSGGSALFIGFLPMELGLLISIIALVWGASVVADSAQFSTALTELSEDTYRGTALTFQTGIGFLVTIPPIWLTPMIADIWGWGPAFAILGIGPMFGITAMLKLRTMPESLACAMGHR